MNNAVFRQAMEELLRGFLGLNVYQVGRYTYNNEKYFYYIKTGSNSSQVAILTPWWTKSSEGPTMCISLHGALLIRNIYSSEYVTGNINNVKLAYLNEIMNQWANYLWLMEGVQ